MKTAEHHRHEHETKHDAPHVDPKPEAHPKRHAGWVELEDSQTGKVWIRGGEVMSLASVGAGQTHVVMRGGREFVVKETVEGVMGKIG